jgi:hypothetical protein
MRGFGGIHHRVGFTNAARIDPRQKLLEDVTLVRGSNVAGAAMATSLGTAAGSGLASRHAQFVSGRSGATTDTFIGDLAVGAGCEELETGAPARCGRLAKCSRLPEITSAQPGMAYELSTSLRLRTSAQRQLIPPGHGQQG